MSEIDSSKWTGPPEGEPVARRHGAFTHLPGQHSFSTDYDRIHDRERIVALIPPELRPLIRLAAWLLILPPILLLGAWFVMISATRDAILVDNKQWLLLWGSTAILLALWQIVSRSMRLIRVRQALVAAAIVGTVAVAILYVLAGVRAHRDASASTTPERTFEIVQSTGTRSSRRTFILHQRADGTLIEGGRRDPLPYARSCALVQRLVGEYGFSWVRVLDRSNAPTRGGLPWPIRREECFSETPLSSLPR